MSIQNYIHFTRISKLLSKVVSTSFYVFPHDEDEQELLSLIQQCNQLIEKIDNVLR